MYVILTEMCEVGKGMNPRCAQGIDGVKAAHKILKEFAWPLHCEGQKE